MAKYDYATITTPRGVLIYPHLTEADTKFVKPDGEYHTKFALPADSDEAAALIEKLEAEMERYIAENPDGLTKPKIKKAARADLYEEEVDDEGEETGRLIFKFKLKAKVKTKTKEWDQQPRLFDGALNPIQEGVNPWTGSEGKISSEVFPYYMETSKTFGLSLRCNAVQILKLVAGQGKSGKDFGFGEEDDAYTTDASAAGFEPEAGDEDGEEF
jgi:hypothetical protein